MTYESEIYVHLAEDGAIFCSFNRDYGEIDDLEPPENTMFSTLEYVENRFFQSDGSDELIEMLEPESERKGEPARVGEIRYDDEKILNLEFDLDPYMDSKTGGGS